MSDGAKLVRLTQEVHQRLNAFCRTEKGRVPFTQAVEALLDFWDEHHGQ